MIPGTKVVCTDDSVSNPRVFSDFQQWPVKGKEYTVRQYRPKNIGGGKEGILLEELRNKPIFFSWVFGKLEPAFDKKRFTPVTEIKTEIEETEEITLGI